MPSSHNLPLKDLRARWNAVIHARCEVQTQHQPHFLQHISVVVDPGFIETKRNARLMGEEVIYGRDPTAQPQIRVSVVTDHHPTLDHLGNIGFAQPNPVSKREVETEEAEIFKMLDDRLVGSTPSVLFMRGRLKQVHMHAHACVDSAT